MEAVEDFVPRRNKKFHARKRIMERFGVAPTDDEFKAICHDIVEGKNLPVCINPENGRSFHPFTVQGVDMVLLYDWDYCCILTAYRRNWFDESNPKIWRLKGRRRRKKK